MVTTIKGPIKIQAGKEIPSELKEAVFKTSSITKKEKETKVEVEAEEVKYIEENLEKLSFTKLRKIGYTLKVRDRNRDKLISEILKAQSCI